MVPQTSCPDSRRWRGLLEGTLPEPEQAELHAHLETCAACQQTLEGLAAEGESWLAAVRGLSSVEEPPVEPALRQALEELQGDFGRITTQAETTGGEEISLDFLAPSAKADALGRLDHYDVLAVIGRGGMGVVLKAFDTVLQRVVAIKVMAPPLAATASARKRFIREAQAAAAVRDEHIIDIHAVAEVNGLPYLVMEYVNGVSLQERLDQSGPLELKEILRIGMQTAAGLDKAHAQGLIHRDIKPANILLENGVQRVKITDFGLARAVDDASLTQSGVIAGTPQYMAPEQARGEPVDHRADLFSLGSVLYAMCTGRPPFRASSMMAVLKRVSEDAPRPIREINLDIPDWLCAIIDKLHAKEPAQRFQSAAEVAELLGQHLAHLQQPALVPMPPRVASPYAGAATAARKHALLRPVLLMLTPLLLIPVVMAASLLSGFFQSLLFGLSLVVSGAATVTGLIWFFWLTARQGQEKAGPPPPTVARPALPRSRERSRALPWALAAACVVGLGCCVLGVPLLGMLGWFVGYTEVRPKSEERVEPVWPDEAAPALEAPLAAVRARRFAPPKDVPITQDGVTATADGWKIENTDFPKRTVRLFEVRDLDVKDCRLVFRLRMKTETKEKLENRRIFTRLEMAFRPKVTIEKRADGDTVTEKSWSDLARSGTTSWAQEEAATNCLSQPEVIALNLLVEGIGTIWIKEVEVVAIPLPAKAR